MIGRINWIEARIFRSRNEFDNAIKKYKSSLLYFRKGELRKPIIDTTSGKRRRIDPGYPFDLAKLTRTWSSGGYHSNRIDELNILLDKVKDIDLKECERISPKANRLALFDGDLLHTGSSPRKHKNKILINSNYSKEDNGR